MAMQKLKGAVIMGKDTIITIGRQCGSGGREVGIALAKDLMDAAAKQGRK